MVAQMGLGQVKGSGPCIPCKLMTRQQCNNIADQSDTHLKVLAHIHASRLGQVKGSRPRLSCKMMPHIHNVTM
jgi:hypothetical protein